MTGAARVRDLDDTRALPPHALLDGEIGNELADAGTTPERREELKHEAGDRKRVRAAIGLDRQALALIETRAGGTS